MILYLITSSLYEMIFMEDPEIISYEKPLSREDKENMLPIEFNKF